MTTLTLQTPADYLLARDACSYGYFLLEPNHWHPDTLTFRTTLLTHDGPTTLLIRQKNTPRSADAVRSTKRAPGKPGEPLVARADRSLSRASRADVRTQLTRILRLDEPHSTIKDFHKLDPRFKRSGRGRLMRSPTLFQDVIRTVTSCNVTWPSTVRMNRRLCETLGERSPSGRYTFPTARKLSRTRPATLRARCAVGYRDQRITDLAKIFARCDHAHLEHPDVPIDELESILLSWPGIGPYAAANILQLLGRYERLPLDTESVRHAKTVLGWTGSSPALMKRLDKHFEPMKHHRFRSYWFELWDYYESKRGPAWTWERDTTGTSFTAAQL